MSFLLENILYFIFAFNVISFVFCVVVLILNILSYLKVTRPQRLAKKQAKLAKKKVLKDVKKEYEKTVKSLESDK